MKFKIVKSRRERLKIKIIESLKDKVLKEEIDSVMLAVDMYQQDNLDTINKLKKEKIYETKRISGALKQTINAHGPITMLLIGSATKRIYGSLLNNTVNNLKLKNKLIIFIIGLIIGLFIGIAL
jgi:hypothetical protein